MALSHRSPVQLIVAQGYVDMESDRIRIERIQPRQSCKSLSAMNANIHHQVQNYMCMCGWLDHTACIFNEHFIRYSIAVYTRTSHKHRSIDNQGSFSPVSHVVLISYPVGQKVQRYEQM